MDDVLCLLFARFAIYETRDFISRIRNSFVDFVQKLIIRFCISVSLKMCIFILKERHELIAFYVANSFDVLSVMSSRIRSASLCTSGALGTVNSRMIKSFTGLVLMRLSSKVMPRVTDNDESSIWHVNQFFVESSAAYIVTVVPSIGVDFCSGI